MKTRRTMGTWKARLMRVAAVSAALVLLGSSAALACTPMGIGKGASADGSVIVSHTCDGWYDQRIQIIPGGTYEEGTMMDVYVDMCTATRPTAEPVKVGEIPQAAQTYTYFHIGYPFMNEKQVMMGEFTWMGRYDLFGPGLLYIANLEQIGLQRAATAKEAVLIMGEMAETYGYGDGGETLIVGDANEIWVFEVCGSGPLWTPESGTPGAHWVAQRLPDDEVFVGANRARIGVVDFDDPDNFLYSTDITVLPQAMGWWEEGTDFDFAKIFNPEPYGAPFYQSRREWRVLSLVAPSVDWPILDEFSAYPFSVKPDEKLTVQDVMTIYSDHYEGTVYDLTVGEAAGAFGSPSRWSLASGQAPEYAQGQDWERALAVPRCSYSFVSQSRSWLPDAIGGVLWFGEDSPDTTVYVPIYAGVTEIPVEWTQGKRDVFDPDSAWWAFNFVNNYANLRWDAIYADIRAKKASYEEYFFAQQPVIEAQAAALYAEDPAEAIKYLTNYTYNTMESVEKGWWDFAWTIVGKYYDGYIMSDTGRQQSAGYPTEYLERVGYAQTALDDLAEIYPAE